MWALWSLLSPGSPSPLPVFAPFPSATLLEDRVLLPSLSTVSTIRAAAGPCYQQSSGVIRQHDKGAKRELGKEKPEFCRISEDD